jgi:MAP/microtubule affinity-regulating kinase
MENLGECSLQDYLKQSDFQLSEHAARNMIYGILDALNYCHQHNIVHRDLKLENILVSPDGTPKLIDFGFTYLADQKISNTFCGTLFYMAPEIILKKPYFGGPADIWAIGVLAYKMMTGFFPFRGLMRPVQPYKL